MKNKNKFINKWSPRLIASIFLTTILLTSCSEEKTIELEPFNSIAEGVAFTTPELVQLSVTGMYNAAALGDYNGGNPRGYIFGAAFVQQGDNRGEDALNLATFYQLTYTGTYDTTTANNTYYWADGYRLINRANIIIEGVTAALQAGTITQAVANDYLGQAKFFRAIAHHEILIHHARPFQDNGGNNPGIPYREIPNNTKPNIDLSLAQGRNTVAECYTKILKDLDDAETLTASKSARAGTAKIERITKEAAIAYKTRVYLHMRRWDKVISEGVKLNGLYAMEASPNTPFSNNLGNSESIFSLAQSAVNNPGANGALANMYHPPVPAATNGRGLVAISPIIWRNSSWLSDDKRREEGTMVVTGVTGYYPGTKFTKKYKDAVNKTDASPIIRYAEVALNMAEAYARENDMINGLARLNSVRNRSLALPATQAYTLATFGLTDNVALLRSVLTERRIEFVMEGRRWADISRLQNDNLAPIVGIPAKVANGGFSSLALATPAYALGTPYTGALTVNAIPYTDFKFIWPIPILETNSNPTLRAQQNPGY
ncbi:MAG: RagB/SusD family nutrient uptake outer membrane protein [Flavobacteriaceae bacterium]|uniref:RagB/SusD family nutrient uptake outer membrane protein n=1 Tax=Flavobacterium kayseriense TaxID=2764714 RepID=A0ABR7J7N1_9FLAO|nr:RagB/SusD family nutrient uptake outer membrane protein [Flavobacterium kayseriense]MBC5841544.1 RagB/SusD family nutrient uptake outer membrane protein [Flavobacterium kayseriense]MBC5848072.1 RagB/SusD family nutrient uptake outer membrane protein [Flavobacterium kayseriense]MBX9888299.1 RagB/SusD family nutrient uptake outer membrane protein [Flavobacteriaceae bacterium]